MRRILQLKSEARRDGVLLAIAKQGHARRMSRKKREVEVLLRLDPGRPERPRLSRGKVFQGFLNRHGAQRMIHDVSSAGVKASFPDRERSCRSDPRQF